MPTDVERERKKKECSFVQFGTLGPPNHASHQSKVPSVMIDPMMTASILTTLVDKIGHLPPTLIYATVGLLAFAEAAIFIGFIFPGETAVIIGGVAASQGHVNIVALCILVPVAAILGDSVGYVIGERHGHHLLRLPIIRHRRGAIDSALEQLKKRGPMYVFLGRFTAFLRAVMPGLAGMSRMDYKKFLLANAAGGIVWGVGFTLIGYLSGHAIHKVEKYVGRFGIGLLILLVAFMVWHHIHAKRKQQAFERDYAATHPEVNDEN